MNRLEAKTILLAWRPDQADTRDPEVMQALVEARRDPVLREWFERHSAFQRSARQNFQVIPVPGQLRDRILARARIVKPVQRWRQPAVLAAAAAVALLLTLGSLFLKPSRADSFQTFRSRMVRTVLRQYTMDLETNDMAQVRQFLRTRGAPSDYVLPQGLSPLPVAGAGVLSWQGRQVSMVCLDSTDQGTLFLFVVDRSAVTQAPSSTPEFEPVSKLNTASWTHEGRTYVLAGAGGTESLRRYSSN